MCLRKQFIGCANAVTGERCKHRSGSINEMSSDPGGLLRWPAKAMLPIGFFLLSLQGFSELIKRIALLRGITPDVEVVVEYHRPDQ